MKMFATIQPNDKSKLILNTKIEDILDGWEYMPVFDEQVFLKCGVLFSTPGNTHAFVKREDVKGKAGAPIIKWYYDAASAVTVKSKPAETLADVLREIRSLVGMVTEMREYLKPSANVMTFAQLAELIHQAKEPVTITKADYDNCIKTAPDDDAKLVLALSSRAGVIKVVP